MKGHDAIVQARLAGVRLSRIDVDVLPRGAAAVAGVEWIGEPVGRLAIHADENPQRLDFRCCHGLPVLVLAGSYAEGWRFAERIADEFPAELRFCAPDMAVRVNDKGMQAWEV